MSIVGIPAVIVFAIGVGFLVYVARLVLAVVLVLVAVGAFLLSPGRHRLATRARAPV